MPFDTKGVTRPFAGCAPVMLPELQSVTKKTKSGDVTTQVLTLVNQCDKKLPEFEQFDLQNQLNAGVPLKQVATTIFAAQSFPLPADFVGEETDTKTTTSSSSDEKVD